MKTLLKRTVHEHRVALDRREYSSVELTRAYLSAMEEENASLGAFLCVDEAGALARSEESDRRMLRGEGRGFFEGIPYSLKDNIAVRGLPMTCASKIMEGYISPYDAAVVERLSLGGAVLLGKNNMDELAIGSTGTHSAYGEVKNPSAPLCACGGSSSGSAASVAAGLSPFSLGTDTGGSVRLPAALCGVIGFKPSFGAVSRYGVAEMASSLDCVGIISRSVEDCRAIFEGIAGKDARDMTSYDLSQNPPISLQSPLRVAMLSWEGDACVSPSVKAAIKNAAEIFSLCGDACFHEELPMPQDALAAYTVLSACEAASNLSRYDGVRFGKRAGEDTLSRLYSSSRAEIGDEALAKILFGVDMLSGEKRERYYLRALRARETLSAYMRTLTECYDLILLPTAATTAFPIGMSSDPEMQNCTDLCTALASLCSLPAISLPVGRDDNGLPIAVQLCAGVKKDALLLAAAQQLINKGGKGFGA